MVLCLIGGLVGTLITLLRCNPVDKAWEVSFEGKCFDQALLFEGVVIFNLVTNVMIILLPMPTIWWLHMPLQRRLVVLGIFSLGFMQVLQKDRHFYRRSADLQIDHVGL